MNHLTNPATPVDRPAAVGAAMTVAFSIGLLAAVSSGQTNSSQTGPVQPGSEGAPATAPPEAPPILLNSQCAERDSSPPR